jgi:uncharacterized protein YukE
MAYIEIDLVKTKECGQEMKKYINEYREIIDQFYKKIDNMPFVTKEWVGQSAEKFSGLVKQDKTEYDKIAEILDLYSDNLINTADRLNNSLELYNNGVNNEKN